MAPMIKGAYLKTLVKLVKDRQGQEGLSKLAKLCKNLTYSSFQNYPLEEEVKLVKAVSEVLYNENSPQSQSELGKIIFHSFADSFIGKTMFSLMGNDIKKTAMAAETFTNTISSGIHIEVEELGPQKIRLIVGECTHHIKHFEGMFIAAIDRFGKQLISIKSKETAPFTYAYTVEWK